MPYVPAIIPQSLRRLKITAAPFAEGSASAMESLMELISDIMDIRFLKQLSGSMFLKITLGNPNISGSGLTEWLMQAEGESDLDALKESVFQKLAELMGDAPERKPSAA